MFLTDGQLRAEIQKCRYCAEKPCREACPADCSPADFIMAASVGEPSDFRRAAALIMAKNPLGGVCGLVCPDRHCMAACSRKGFDAPVEIPAIQAAIVEKAKALGVMPELERPRPTGRRVAVLGAGPAGLGAAAVLAQRGHTVHVFDRAKKPGGMARLVPAWRLDPEVLASDIDWLLTLGDIGLKLGKPVPSPKELLTRGYEAVIVATGLTEPLRLGIPGEELTTDWVSYLGRPKATPVKGKRVAVIGGGAVAVDCAETAARAGAAHVELFALEKLGEMPLTAKERASLVDAGVHVSGRVRVSAVLKRNGRVAGLATVKVALPAKKPFHPRSVVEVKDSQQLRKDLDLVIVAIGARPGVRVDAHPRVFAAGDLENGPTTVVEAVAAGKNAAALADAALGGEAEPGGARKTRSRVLLRGHSPLPVPLTTDFFGREIASPFLLSAAPPSDGYEQMKKAYEAGWAGGVMKTAFDDVPIHIPAGYMFAFTQDTYANCDNVSGHALDRVRRELERLRREYPDRLTMASTGGPVTGDDESDARVWQSNTRKLESAGAMGIEYSLSCPQGGDGTKGDIVSQDAELTAKIVDWVLQVSAPEVPKLFKLTAAVTSIYPIMSAIAAVLARHPHRKAGVTLANTFPTLTFRKGAKERWEEGIVVGMSGAGVAPISYLTLANVSRLGITVSGNGGPMDYKAAANFLALGARTVQFCTVVMKHGYGVVDELHSGVSHLMAERGLRSTDELIGAALPDPIRGFMELPATKQISAVDAAQCQHCGNCTRCPYLAVSLDRRGVPTTDPARCIGCSICVQKCFAGAMHMRARTPAELAALVEA